MALHILSTVMNMWRKGLFVIALLLFAAMLLLRPEVAAEAAREGLRLCLQSVIPALFPMMAVTGLLLRLGAAERLRPLFAPFMGPLFGLGGGCALPLLAGAVGGYPVGADAAAELYRRGGCTKGEAERLLSFCNNCGPAFLLSFVGAGVFGSALVGCRLYLIQMGAALLVGVILCRLAPRRAEPLPLPVSGLQRRESIPAAFTLAVTGAFRSVLSICAFVTLFTVFVKLLPLGEYPAAAGLLEMTTGLSRLTDSRFHRAAAAGLVSFGGLSVHCQTAAVLGDTGLSLRLHFVGKLLQAGLAAGAAWLLL